MIKWSKLSVLKAILSNSAPEEAGQLWKGKLKYDTSVRPKSL